MVHTSEKGLMAERVNTKCLNVWVLSWRTSQLGVLVGKGLNRIGGLLRPVKNHRHMKGCLKMCMKNREGAKYLHSYVVVFRNEQKCNLSLTRMMQTQQV